MKLNRIAPSSEDDLVGEGEFFQDLSLYWLGEYLKRANLELSQFEKATSDNSIFESANTSTLGLLKRQDGVDTKMLGYDIYLHNRILQIHETIDMHLASLIKSQKRNKTPLSDSELVSRSNYGSFSYDNKLNLMVRHQDKLLKFYEKKEALRMHGVTQSFHKVDSEGYWGAKKMLKVLDDTKKNTTLDNSILSPDITDKRQYETELKSLIV